MSKTLIYLASPYSASTKEQRHKNYELVCVKAAELMEKGYAVFCPIAHSHAIETVGMSGKIQDGQFWLEQDFAILSRCDELHVYQMPGWEKSYGVFAEMAFAKFYNIPIYYIPFDGAATTLGTGVLGGGNTTYQASYEELARVMEQWQEKDTEKNKNKPDVEKHEQRQATLF